MLVTRRNSKPGVCRNKNHSKQAISMLLEPNPCLVYKTNGGVNKMVTLAYVIITGEQKAHED